MLGATRPECAIIAAKDGVSAKVRVRQPFSIRPMNTSTEPDNTDEPIHEPRRWRDNGWTAQVIKNENDEGWAVSMTPDGQSEPALTGPWTMGRDKKNPKPLDTNAFNTLVKTAHEVVRRHEQHLQATLHKQVDVSAGSGVYTVSVVLPRIQADLDVLTSLGDGTGAKNGVFILQAGRRGGQIGGHVSVSLNSGSQTVVKGHQRCFSVKR